MLLKFFSVYVSKKCIYRNAILILNYAPVGMKFLAVYSQETYPSCWLDGILKLYFRKILLSCKNWLFSSFENRWWKFRINGCIIEQLKRILVSAFFPWTKSKNSLFLKFKSLFFSFFLKNVAFEWLYIDSIRIFF